MEAKVCATLQQNENEQAFTIQNPLPKIFSKDVQEMAFFMQLKI